MTEKRFHAMTFIWIPVSQEWQKWELDLLSPNNSVSGFYPIMIKYL